MGGDDMAVEENKKVLVLMKSKSKRLRVNIRGLNREKDDVTFVRLGDKRLQEKSFFDLFGLVVMPCSLARELIQA